MLVIYDSKILEQKMVEKPIYKVGPGSSSRSIKYDISLVSVKCFTNFKNVADYSYTPPAASASGCRLPKGSLCFFLESNV